MSSDFDILMQSLLQQQGVAPPVPARKPFVPQKDAPRGIRNNNPGNIRDYGIPWEGLSGVEKVSNNPDEPGFVTFKSPVMGIRALARDLSTKYENGYDTIEKIVTKYAPTSENDTESYINSVAKQTGFKRDEKLTLNDDTLLKLVKAKIFHENGKIPYDEDLIVKGINLQKRK